VRNYPIQDWFFVRSRPYKPGVYCLLWLDGHAPYGAITHKECQHHLVRIKKLLTLYAEGKVEYE